MLITILIILLVLGLFGGVYNNGAYANYSFPFGVIVLVVIVILLLRGSL